MISIFYRCSGSDQTVRWLFCDNAKTHSRAWAFWACLLAFGCQATPGRAQNSLLLHDPAAGVWRDANPKIARIVGGRLGQTGCIALSGDYDADGLPDIAAYDTVTCRWFVSGSRDGTMFPGGAEYGAQPFLPLAGDIDGDRGCDLVLYDPADCRWYAYSPLSGQSILHGDAWGAPGYLPMLADFDGDGLCDRALYDPLTGEWFIKPSSPSADTITVAWGNQDMTPCPADYNGDGAADLAVFDHTRGQWHVRSFLDGHVISYGFEWGYSGVTPVPLDMDGNGRAELGIYDRTRGLWFSFDLGTDKASLFGWPWGGNRWFPVQSTCSVAGLLYRTDTLADERNLVAMIQHRVREPNRVRADLDILAERVRAASVHAKVVILPETPFYRYSPWTINGVTMADLAASYNAICARLSQLAAEQGICLISGIREPCNQNKVYNTAVVFGPTGALLWKQRKFLPSIAEIDYTVAGPNPVVFQSPIGRLILAICKDTTHPKLPGILADAQPATLVVLSADPDARSLNRIGPMCANAGCPGLIVNQLIRDGNSGYVWPNGQVTWFGGAEGIFYVPLSLCSVPASP